MAAHAIMRQPYRLRVVPEFGVVWRAVHAMAAKSFLRRWRCIHGAAIPLVAYTVITIVATFPYVLQLGDHLRDPGDPFEYAWLLGFGAYQLVHDPLHLYDGNIFYPFPLSVAYSDSSVPNILLGAPIVLATGNPVLALNLLTFLTYILGAFGMYLLVKQRTGSPAAAFAAGVFYGFSPYRYDHLAQLPNVSMEWAPFALWSFDRYLTSGRARWAAGLVAFSVLQVLASFYYAFILGIGIGVYVLLGLIQSAPVSLRPARLLPLLGITLAGAALATPFIEPYFFLSRAFGLRRTLGDAVFFSAWPANFLAATPTMRYVLIDPLIRLIDHAPWNQAPIGASERHLYPGTLVILLAVAGVSIRRWWRTLAPLAMVVSGVVLSLGPVLHTAQGVTLGLPVPMPYTVLFDYLPGFAALRVPSRFAALVVLGLAILAGDGLASLVSRLDQPPVRWPRWVRPGLLLAALCTAIGVVEGLDALPLVPVRVGTQLPPVYRWLASDAEPGPILELPIDYDAFRESPRAYYSTYHHHPLVDGFRSFAPPAYAPLASVLDTFPSSQAVGTAERLGVRYVIVHEAERTAKNRLAPPPARWIPGIERVAQFGTDAVYRIVGRPAPSPVTVAPSLVGCLPPPGTTVTIPVDLRAADGEPVIVLAPGTTSLTFNEDWRRRDGASQRFVVTVPVPASVILSPTRLELALSAPAKPGQYSLVISLAGQAGLHVASRPEAVVVGSGSPAEGGALPHLVSAILLSQRPAAAEGVGYELGWWMPHGLGRPVVVFVNAYDARDHYWSYPIEGGTRFPQSGSCPSGFALQSGRLPLRPDIQPGQYWIEAGLLDAATQQRIPFVGPTGQVVTSVQFGSFWIRPQNVFPPGTFPPPAEIAGSLGSLVALDQGAASGKPGPGRRLTIALRWRDLEPVPTNLTAFVHLVDEKGNLIAQHDGQPTNGVYPTSAWLPGETIVEEETLRLPAVLPAGPYHLEIGLYDLKSGQRLPVLAPDGRPAGDHIDLPVP